MSKIEMKQKILSLLEEQEYWYLDLLVLTTHYRSYDKDFDSVLKELRIEEKIDYYIKDERFPYWYFVSDKNPKTDHSSENFAKISA